jgi:rhodanese-related sulfurtransferase
MTDRITPAALKPRIARGPEIALLDVRDEPDFVAGHLLMARSLPLRRMDIAPTALLPRKSVPIVLIDNGDGVAERAAGRFAQFGYTDLAVLDGGVKGWGEAGFVLFSGVNVPSKAFGEYVEERFHTPSISAEELKAKLDAGEDLVILDSRPWPEYQRMSIPKGIDLPGAELAYRAADVAPSAKTLVVVNCAGRTRSIIGAQSLINAQVPNRVVALRNGTMGWELAGFQVERGATRRVMEVSDGALLRARAAAAQVAVRFGVKKIDKTTLEQFRREADRRSLYLLDVRHPEEYEAGHVAGSLSAPGGQLVQATDRYVGALRARLVLIDDTGVRATMTASWLRQMGWDDVFVLDRGLEGPLETGPEPPSPQPQPPPTPSGNFALGAAEREAAMRQYLAWELGLVEAVKRDGTLHFPDFGA